MFNIVVGVIEDWVYVVVFAHDYLFGVCKITKIANLPDRLLSPFSVDTTGPQNAVATKAVYGVCVDPHDGHRIASFAEVSNGELSQYL